MLHVFRAYAVRGFLLSAALSAAALSPALALGAPSDASPQADAAPQLDAPVYATIRPEPLVLTGRSFGTPGPEARLVVRQGRRETVIASTSARILGWHDDRIVVATDAATRSVEVRVRTADGQTPFVPAEVYDYTWYDIPPTPGTNALPLAIAVGADGQVWVNEEFHLHFQHLDPATGVVTGLPIPMPPDPGPFASMIFGDHPTQTSELGESILVDPRGRVWFTQGGGSLYTGQYPNHSRVVSFDPAAPAADRFRVYNVPGDRNEVIGIAWDEGRGRMWVAQSGLEATGGPALASFDPEGVPWDNDFDFSTPLLDQVCGEGEPEDDCYRVYRLPETSLLPAHLAVTADGLVWYTGYWGSLIGVLDPETEAVTEYPLPEQTGSFFFGPGPWEIVAAPNGDLVYTEFFDSAVGRFDASRRLDPACRQLDAAGRNPCIVERVLPGIDPEGYYLHTVAFADDGRLWFGQHVDAEEQPSHLGYFTADGRHVVVLPPLQRFDGGNGAAPNVDGVAVSPTTGDVYFCEFERKRIGRLHLVTGGDAPEALASAHASTEAPASLSVSAFPAPSRGPVTVAVNVPSAGHAAVVVYDLLGRRVAALHEGPVAAGRLALAFNRSTLPAGVYYVSVTAYGTDGRALVASTRVAFAR